VVACDDRDRVRSREAGSRARDRRRGGRERRESASEDDDASWNGGEDTGEHGGREQIGK